jgi:hypothetical protein
MVDHDYDLLVMVFSWLKEIYLTAYMLLLIG